MARGGDGRLGGALGCEVEGRAHGEVVARWADEAVDAVGDPVGEIAGAAASGRAGDGDRRGLRGGGGSGVEAAGGDHGVKHRGGAGARGAEVAGRRVAGSAPWASRRAPRPSARVTSRAGLPK